MVSQNPVRAPLDDRQGQQVQKCPLAVSVAPASDGRATTKSLPSRAVPTRHSVGLGCRRLGLVLRASLSAKSVQQPQQCLSSSPSCGPRCRLATRRWVGTTRCEATAPAVLALVWLCRHHYLNSSQPPVPIWATLGYKPSSSLRAFAALQPTMFSTSHQPHACFALRCTAVGATAASFNSVHLSSISRRRANQSLKRTRHGMQPWPRSAYIHLAPRGQGFMPRRAA